ncbi:transposase [Aquabacterium sp.]|uniref:transposase n=1 Tax=Aquabacterium sp. TaxID=1872578 RepID=UPI0019857265|nr:transposase [Aquabacterium sp.]MBC7700685.1 transposase [Aquabacterium sp.]
MARMPRLSGAGWPHMVVQHVHEGQALVRDETDVALLLRTLTEAAREESVAIHAHVIAIDHLHLLATPSTDEGLSRLMQSVGRRYVAAYNRRHDRRGGLWSGRYRCTVIEAARYLLDCMVFIEQHALRTGAVQQLAEDHWSSVGHHLGLRVDPLIQDHPLYWALGNTPFDREAAWRKRLEQGLSHRQVSDLANATHKGWALGGDDFLQKVQVALGRPVQPKPRGRPRRLSPVVDVAPK